MFNRPNHRQEHSVNNHSHKNSLVKELTLFHWVNHELLRVLFEIAENGEGEEVLFHFQFAFVSHHFLHMSLLTRLLTFIVALDICSLYIIVMFIVVVIERRMRTI
jgi:hypothetical protein